MKIEIRHKRTYALPNVAWTGSEKEHAAEISNCPFHHEMEMRTYCARAPLLLSFIHGTVVALKLINLVLSTDDDKSKFQSFLYLFIFMRVPRYGVIPVTY